MSSPFSRVVFAVAAVACLLAASVASADDPSASPPQSPAREIESLNADWRFHLGDPPECAADPLNYAKLKDWLLPCANAFVVNGRQRARPTDTPPPGEDVSYAKPGFDDSGWRLLNLPHDWAIEGPFVQTLNPETGRLAYAGVGWYRRTLEIPAGDQGRRFYLNIDGAMSYSTVWCNGRFVGGWPCGYTSYQLDLTPYLKVGAANTLAIRLDNPADSSRWYPGAGLYRKVTLTVVNPVHFVNWGVQVRTAEVSADAAKIVVSARAEWVPGGDRSKAPGQGGPITGETGIYEVGALGIADGPALVLSKRTELTDLADAGPDHPVEEKFEPELRLTHPRLWSPDSPHLYAAVTQLWQGGKIIDANETIFGVREAKFDADGGFFLNGKHLKIQGVCQHQDLGALGMAFNESAARRQLLLLKAAGCNAIRIAHNPPAPEWLDLCDKLGLLVMDDGFDSWRLVWLPGDWHTIKRQGDYHLLFDDWHEADLRAWMRRDGNHPSVVIYGLGNEVPDIIGPAGAPLAAELSRMAHEERPEAITSVVSNNREACYAGAATEVDVFGLSYLPAEYERFHKVDPAVPAFGSEVSATISTRGEYFFPLSVALEDMQASSYDLHAVWWSAIPDYEFALEDKLPYFAGAFAWTGFDYLGEPSPYRLDATERLLWSDPARQALSDKTLRKTAHIPVTSRSSYFGMIDLAGFPKDLYYLYQARWQPDVPMAHLVPHWTWPGREGQVTPVLLYTSGDTAELFVNGRSQGIRKKGADAYRLFWDQVKYEPGELKVVVTKDGKPWAGAVERTAGLPAKVQLAAEGGPVLRAHAPGEDLCFLRATIVDAAGAMVPAAKNAVRFAISSGPGEIVATDNGDPTSYVPFASREREAFNGLALVIVRVKGGQPGKIVVTAESAGLESGKEEILATD